MKCILPPALDEQTLMSYVDGLADDATRSHIEQCETCREQVGVLARFESRLSTRLSRIDCPSPLELGEYQLEMISKSQKLVISAHVRECPNCAREVAGLKSFLALPDPTTVLQKMKVLIAHIVGWNPDTALSGGLVPVPALRGNAPAPLTLQAEGMLIVLDVQPGASGGLDILGQVAAEDEYYWMNAFVEIKHASGSKITTTLDDLNGFHLEGLEAGPKDMRIISCDNSVMVLSSFSLAK